MVKVKICGITNSADALTAANCGATALGFVFYKKSPRYVSPSKVKKIVESLPPFVTSVGVFVNISERAVRDICRFTGITTIQLHGDEDRNYCKRLKDYKVIKAFHVGAAVDFKKVTDYNVDAYLFDTFTEEDYGGSGKTFNWDLLKDKKLGKPFILSGGLNPENIKTAIETVLPYAVDVSSGVEKTPGIKDYHKIRALFDAVNLIK